MASPRLMLCRHLRAHALLRLAEVGGELGAEILRLVNLADLDVDLAIAVEGRPALDPLDRLLFRLDLDQAEAAEQFVRRGEGAVGDGRLARGKLDAGTFRARV